MPRSHRAGFDSGQQRPLGVSNIFPCTSPSKKPQFALNSDHVLLLSFKQGLRLCSRISHAYVGVVSLDHASIIDFVTAGHAYVSHYVTLGYANVNYFVTLSRANVDYSARKSLWCKQFCLAREPWPGLKPGNLFPSSNTWPRRLLNSTLLNVYFQFVSLFVFSRTPLQCAAHGGFVKFMTVLIEHGAELDHQDKDGITALHWSCASGHLEAVKLLIRNKAFPNFTESDTDR